MEVRVGLGVRDHVGVAEAVGTGAFCVEGLVELGAWLLAQEVASRRSTPPNRMKRVVERFKDPPKTIQLLKYPFYGITAKVNNW